MSICNVTDINTLNKYSLWENSAMYLLILVIVQKLVKHTTKLNRRLSENYKFIRVDLNKLDYYNT